MTRTFRIPTAAALLLAGLATAPALAQPAASAAGYQVAAQPLDQALASLARQAGLQLLLPSELTQGRQGRAVQGARDIGSALDELLRGSGLRGHVDGKTLVVERVPVQPAETVLPTVRASASAVRETATGPVQGYRATRSATATRTDVALIDTPVSVQTVGRELMEDQKTLKLADALANVSGVFAAHGPDGNTMDAFVIRGFEVDSYGATYLDGSKDFSRSPKETAGLERVEVLKGPAAIMYGRIEPGGMINRVSKRPQAEDFTTVAQEVGTDQHYRTTLDSTGALNADASWLYRINAVTVDEDGFKDDTHNRRLYIAPQVEWRPSTATTVRAGLDYLKEKRSWALTYGTIGDANGPVDIPVETNLHGKDEYYREESATFKVEWTHKLDERWQLQQRASYGERNSVSHGSWLSEADADGNYIRQYWGWEGEKSKVTSTNLELTGKLQTGSVKHTLLVGADHFDEKYDSGGWAFGGTPVTSNIHAPVDDNSYSLDYGVQAYAYRNRNTGLFVQDQAALFDERLQLLLGLRRDDAKYSYTFDTTTMVADDSKTTWRAGLLYKLQPTLAVYASYVTGFGQSQFDWSTGSAFPPQTSKQLEIGTKWEPAAHLSLTVAAFELVKDNLTMGDPENPLRTILAGEATSKGIEIDAAGRIGRNLELVASYTYTDPRYTRSDTLQGERFSGVPRHGASLWGTYHFDASGWRAGAGVIARSSMLGTQRAWAPDLYPYTLDGYVLLNAMLGHDFQLAGHDARAQLNVHNLTDERYNPTTYGGTNRIGLGAPRSVVASLSVSF